LGDIDLYTYAHYINIHGLTLDELENASSLRRIFYTASMLVMKEQETKNQVALAEYTGKLSNPFLVKK
jgi:hypothetical protein